MGRLGELLVILAIVFLLFGSRRLKDFGSDLGAAIRGFKTHIGGDDTAALPNSSQAPLNETLTAEQQRV